MKKYFITTAVVVGAALFGLALWWNTTRTPTPIACTLEAKQCPDGSYVGRTAPRCEFAQCPGTSSTNDWKTVTDDKQGITFQYPNQLTTTYIHTADWPPQVVVTSGQFTCSESGSEITPAGQTQKRIVGNTTYCVTEKIEGAAGSTYTQYVYTFAKNDKVVLLTFSFRSVQCANYDEPQKTQCSGEREAFDVDSVVDRMAQSVTLK